LVTGGAGYIGSHTVKALVASGEKVIVLDNLVYGHRDAIDEQHVIFIQGDLGDRTITTAIFEKYVIRSVMHFAAYAYVGESVTDPSKYYQNNLVAPIHLLDVMREQGCHSFIFSSTCATYGVPQFMPMTEDHPQDPINPYGGSKWMLERVLKDYHTAYGLHYAILRYFNAAGSAADGSIGEDHNPETHLIPLIFDAVLGKRDHITIFGTDYNTPDGTCIRDYIHVEDLATAHMSALRELEAGSEEIICNLGTGIGHSVKEVIKTIEEVTGKPVPVQLGERRAGDPAKLIADPSLAKKVLKWQAGKADLRQIVADAWKWRTNINNGKFEK